MNRSKLVEAAKRAQKRAYCPYTRYPVGAAVLGGSGRIYTGCNVENASLGLSNCAERTAVFTAVAAGEKKIKAVAVAARSAKPCGACRQVLNEFAAQDLEVFLVDLDPAAKRHKVTKTKLSRLLPRPFNPTEAGL